MENEKSIPRKRTAWNKGTLIVFNLASADTAPGKAAGRWAG